MSRTAAGGRVRRFFRHPLTWITFLFLVLAAVVWFLGPLVAFGEARPLDDTATRLAVLLGLTLLWGGFAAAIGWRRASEDTRLLSALRQQKAENEAASERNQEEGDRRFAVIRRKFDETLARLGRDRGRSRLGRRAFRLPWYLVIGPEGAGKTALLLNAELNLPFGPPKGAGGPTDDVDFVFAQNAVFLDVSGRLAGNAAETALDQTLWLRLLGLVKRLRRRQPVCGIVVVLDAANFAELSEEERLTLARTLRRRLDEAGERFRARPPVYLVFSKLDHLLGFSAFFFSTDRSERAAPWGTAFLASEEEQEFSVSERFRGDFSSLTRRVAEWRLPRLQEEPDAQRRALINEFPDQFAALGDFIAPVVEILALPHRFDRPPFLRGVFFTSAHQGGQAVDMLGLTAGRKFVAPTGLPWRSEPATTGSRSYFLHGLLSSMIPLEAVRSGLSAAAYRFTTSWQIAGAALLALLVPLLALQWISSYRASATFAETVESSAVAVSTKVSEAKFGPTLPPFPAVLPPLNSLHALEELDAYGSRWKATELSSLETSASQAYGAGLERLLVPYLSTALRATLADNETGAADLFQSLKLYLALAGERPLSTVDLPRLAPWLAGRWLADYSEADRRAFIAHVEALGTHTITPQTADASLVATARERIATYTLAQLAFDLAKTRPEVVALAPWRPSDHAGASGPLVIVRADGSSLWEGLPGFFTRSAFRDVSLPAIRSGAAEIERDAWVLGPSADANARELASDALALYSGEAIRQWDSLLADVSVRPMATVSDGARVLSLVLATPSPVAELLASVGAETDLSPPPAAAGVTGALDAVAQAAPAALGLAAQDDPGRAVTQTFEPVRQATALQDGKSQVTAVIAAFEPLYRALNSIAQGGNALELGNEPQTASAQVDTLVAALPPKLQPIFKRLQTAAMDLIQGASGERLRDVWNTTVLPACEAATAKRFPFVYRAQEETAFDDFKALFGPEGQLAGFRDAYLKPLIDTSARPWKWRPGRPTELNLDDAALAAFERADAITQAFFPGGEGPVSRFTILPVKLDDKVQAARLDIGGQTLRYAHGPAIPMSAQWPPATPNAPAALTMTPEVDGSQNMLMGEGTWALFRLFDQAASRRLVNGNDMLATFSLAGRALTVKITPGSTRNPFELMLLEKFRCPRL